MRVFGVLAGVVFALLGTVVAVTAWAVVDEADRQRRHR